MTASWLELDLPVEFAEIKFIYPYSIRRYLVQWMLLCIYEIFYSKKLLRARDSNQDPYDPIQNWHVCRCLDHSAKGLQFRDSLDAEMNGSVGYRSFVTSRRRRFFVKDRKSLSFPILFRWPDPWCIFRARKALPGSSQLLKKCNMANCEKMWSSCHKTRIYFSSQAVLIKLVLPQAAQLGFYFFEKQ